MVCHQIYTDRLQEFPVLGVPEKYKLPSKPFYRMLVLVIFPIFLDYLLVYHISIRRTILKLDFIAEKSKFLSESLENPSFLIDFDN